MTIAEPQNAPDGWQTVRLGDVAEQCLGKMLDAKKTKGRALPYLRNPNVRWFDVDTSDLRTMPFEDHELDRYGLRGGDVLICEGGEAGRAAIWDGRAPDVKFQKAIHRVRPGPGLLNRFLVHQLRADYQSGRLSDYYTGATIKHLTGQDLLRYKLALPPVAEQHRIAAVLDHAEALRTKRRATVTQLDALIQSLFRDMFGDTRRNDRSWPTACLHELLSVPLRNGVSPSQGASVEESVLTLSAVTGAAFDPSARRVAAFRNAPRPNQLVDERDLLICRGNGNLELVGKGYFPTVTMKDVIFPDTMIAARVASTRADAAFLEHLWNSDAVRTQVQGLARTTNGTFKVNQTMLEGITVVVPPLSLQRDFANRRRVIAHTRAAFHAGLTRLDALVASLQYSAFRGEL